MPDPILYDWQRPGGPAAPTGFGDASAPSSADLGWGNTSAFMANPAPAPAQTPVNPFARAQPAPNPMTFGGRTGGNIWDALRGGSWNLGGQTGGNMAGGKVFGARGGGDPGSVNFGARTNSQSFVPTGIPGGSGPMQPNYLPMQSGVNFDPQYGGYGTTNFGSPFQMPGAGFTPQSPFGGPQGGAENRGFSQTGLDPRLDSVYGYALQQALNQYANPNGSSYYPGQTVAQLTPDEMAAQQMLRGMAYGGAGGIPGSATGYYNTILDRAINPQNDPALQASIDAMSRDTMRAATDPGGIYSQIRQGAIGNGTLGSSRQGIAEGIASSRIADSIAAQDANMRLAARGQNLGAAGSALGQTGTVAGAATLPAQWLSGVGAQNRGINQANLDAGLQAWLYNTYEPDRRLQNLYSLIGATPFGGYQATSQNVGSSLLPGANGGTSTAQNVAGGVTGAVGLYQILRQMGIL